MIDRLDFSHERELTIEELMKRIVINEPEANVSLLKKAYEFAAKAHENQKRSSGEPYIIHPLNVSGTLVKLRMDMDSIISGLLHDVVEDCDVSTETIEKEFNSNIAQIVTALTKISKIKFKSKEESQAENFRKMIIAMAKDLRVIIVKLADRMHNMRTLQYISIEKQQRIAQETLDIYVPLASRLGINSVKAELEDLCLRFLKPEVYYKLAEKVAMKKSEREKYILEVVDLINEKLHEYSVNAEVKGRSKHFYSIYKKISQRNVDFDQIQDLLAFRIVVDNITECYKGLGVIHSAFTPIPGRFKDYIAIPKVNNYQSLHTTVIGPRGERIEIQIRTFEMHEVAEKGVAAHWKYKEGAKDGERKLKWVEELLEFDQSAKSTTEVLEVVKNDLDIGGIFIFTPKGDVFELKYGATPLDFAYTVHTEIGNKCVGAKVNGKIVPLKYRLKSGDTVEVLTSKTQTPTKDWLKIVKTTRARTKINQYLLKVEREKNRDIGLELLEKSLKMFGTSIKQLEKEGRFSKALEKFQYKNVDDLIVNIGSGKPKIHEVILNIPGIDSGVVEKLPEIDSYYNKVQKTVKKNISKDNAVVVDGSDDVFVRLARCCNPIPGDIIMGFITRGRGITVHTSHCERISEEDRSRVIKVDWNPEYSFKHPVNIKVLTHDKPGILALISKTINNQGINIRSAIAKSMPDQKGSFIFEVEVKDFSELLKVISGIESMDEVISVSRV